MCSRNMHSFCVIKEGMLGIARYSDLQVVILEALKIDVLKPIHDTRPSGYYQNRWTVERMESKYWGCGWLKD